MTYETFEQNDLTKLKIPMDILTSMGFDRDKLEQFILDFEEHYPAHLPHPKIFIAPPNKIFLKWDFNDWYVIADLDFQKNTLKIQAAEVHHREVHISNDSLFMDAHGWERMTSLIEIVTKKSKNETNIH